ncbi:MAG: hypothetical protein IJV27_06025 [Prevotella sp.]|nr:hypothetical protein [Prevotella sp.]
MMKRLLPLLILLLATLLGCTGEGMPSEWTMYNECTMNRSAEGRFGTSKNLHCSLVQNASGHRQLELLNDARSIYRLCNTRPQRLLPTHGSKPGKSIGRLLAVRRPRLKQFFFLHDGRRRLETAPFQSAASRDYYVFALRRILC